MIAVIIFILMKTYMEFSYIRLIACRVPKTVMTKENNTGMTQTLNCFERNNIILYTARKTRACNTQRFVTSDYTPFSAVTSSFLSNDYEVMPDNVRLY